VINFVSFEGVGESSGALDRVGADMIMKFEEARITYHWVTAAMHITAQGWELHCRMELIIGFYYEQSE